MRPHRLIFPFCILNWSRNANGRVHSVESVILISFAKSCITLSTPLPKSTQGQVIPYTPARKILQVRIHFSLTSLRSFCHHITHLSLFANSSDCCITRWCCITPCCTVLLKGHQYLRHTAREEVRKIACTTWFSRHKRLGAQGSIGHYA